MVPSYRLVVTQIDHTCFFELSWGNGQQILTQLPYPNHLATLYRRWQDNYLEYYRRMPPSSPTPPLRPQPSTLNPQPSNVPPSPTPFRARSGVTGTVSVTEVDWHSQLVQSEAKLLSEFHRWLRSEPLFPIRRQLGTAIAPTPIAPLTTTLFLTCSPTHLARLPWETWEVTAEFGQHRPLRIARLPAQVTTAATPPRSPRSKTRILVVLGDGIANTDEISQLQRTLNPLADIHCWPPTSMASGRKQEKAMGYADANPSYDSDLSSKSAPLPQPSTLSPSPLPHFPTSLCTTITDPEGWDMLFFLGHSNEARDVGGVIAIAPNVSLSMSELESSIKVAQANGLQFAVFNSCMGLDIADTLVGWGLNQVVIMREPIHHQVAAAFLSHFLHRLAQFDDVHGALQNVTQTLRSENNLTYPSAHLLPSLFCHRGAELFQFKPVGWRSILVRSLPTLRQGMALGAIAFLSCHPGIRDLLLDTRLHAQAHYRQTTQPLSTATLPHRANTSSPHSSTEQSTEQSTPPVLLVHIDDDSIRRDVADFDENHMDRRYLADLVKRINALGARVIGLDYWFHRRQGKENDIYLNQAFQDAVAAERWLITGSVIQGGIEKAAIDDLAHPHWSMSGYTHASWFYLKLPPQGTDCGDRCPFAYLLALTRLATAPSTEVPLVPTLDRSIDLKQTFIQAIDTATQQSESITPLQQLYTLRTSLLSLFLRQRWLQPIVDYSIPPHQVYDRLSSHQLYTGEMDKLGDRYDWPHQVVILGAGGYNEAGTENTKDYLEQAPTALQYWRHVASTVQSTDVLPTYRLTGAEVHAYAVHHFLQDHRIIPIPTLWMVGLATIVGTGSAMLAQQTQLPHRRRWLLLTGATIGYGLIGFQAHITASIILPWLLPTATIWVYHLPMLTRRKRR